MKYDKKDLAVKAKAVGIAAVLVGAGIVGGFVADNPDTIVEEKIIEKIVIPDPVVEYVDKEVEKLVEVDNGNLDLVLDYLEDNFGDEYLVFEDVNDIVKNIKAEDSYKEKAIDGFKDNFKDYISVPEDYVLSEADLVKIRDAEVRAIDYEDKEFVVSFEAEVKFENEDGKETIRYDVTYDYDLDRDDNEDLEITVLE